MLVEEFHSGSQKGKSQDVIVIRSLRSLVRQRREKIGFLYTAALPHSCAVQYYSFNLFINNNCNAASLWGRNYFKCCLSLPYLSFLVKKKKLLNIFVKNHTILAYHFFKGRFPVLQNRAAETSADCIERHSWAQLNQTFLC